MTVQPGQTTEGVRLTTVARGDELVTVTGRVLVPEGDTPAVAALVQCHGLSPAVGGHTFGVAQAVTDSQGAFTIVGRSRRPLTVAAWLPGIGEAVTERLVPTDGRCEAHLTLESGAVLSGRVTRGDGVPVPNTCVAIQPPREEWDKHWKPDTVNQWASVHTDGDGCFNLEGVPAGRWLLHAAIENTRRTPYLPLTITAGETRDGLELKVAPFLPDVTIRVVGPHGKTPVADAQLSLEAPAAEWPRVHTNVDENGRFRLRWMVPGDYCLEVLRREPKPSWVRFPVALAPGNAELVLRMPRPATITGHVRLAGGTLRGATVRTYVGSDQPVNSALTRTSAQVDEDGAYRLEGLAPGEYTVYCFADQQEEIPTASIKVTVREGEAVRAPELVME